MIYIWSQCYKQTLELRNNAIVLLGRGGGGQSARLQLWQCEFESRWRLQFFSVKFESEK